MLRVPGDRDIKSITDSCKSCPRGGKITQTLKISMVMRSQCREGMDPEVRRQAPKSLI